MVQILFLYFENNIDIYISRRDCIIHTLPVLIRTTFVFKKVVLIGTGPYFLEKGLYTGGPLGGPL